MADQDVPMGAPDSTMGDPLLLNGLIKMLRNGQGENITRMVQEAISKVVPTPSKPLSTSQTMAMGISTVAPPSLHDPIMPSDTPNIMQMNMSSRCVMPSTSRLDTPTSRVISSTMPHNMPLRSSMGSPTIPVVIDMHTHARSIPESLNNPSSVHSIKILPQTPEQASLRSLIESQSKSLRLLPDSPENAEYRKEIHKQIMLWERTLLGTAGTALDEQETNENETHVPIVASTSTPQASNVSLVTTKGAQEVTLLLTSEGEVFKDEMGMTFFHFIYHRSEQLFGNTVQRGWRNQCKLKKAELCNDVIMAFGDPGFDEEYILEIAQKYIHSKRDNLRCKLKNDLSYPRPTWITDPTTWDELIKDGKFKRKRRDKTSDIPVSVGGSKRRLRDITKATQARVSGIGSHKLRSGRYSSIRGALVHQFQKEASREDLKFALLNGYQCLRKHMLDQGDILAGGHENEGAQQSNSPRSENGDEVGERDEIFVVQNNSNIIPQPQQETMHKSQHVGNNNYQEGSQCHEQTAPTIRMVPRKKRTQRKKMYVI